MKTFNWIWFHQRFSAKLILQVEFFTGCISIYISMSARKLRSFSSPRTNTFLWLTWRAIIYFLTLINAWFPGKIILLLVPLIRLLIICNLTVYFSELLWSFSFQDGGTLSLHLSTTNSENCLRPLMQHRTLDTIK